MLYKGSHSFTCHQTRAISAFTLQPQSITALWPILIAPIHQGMASNSLHGLVQILRLVVLEAWPWPRGLALASRILHVTTGVLGLGLGWPDLGPGLSNAILALALKKRSWPWMQPKTKTFLRLEQSPEQKDKTKKCVT